MDAAVIVWSIAKGLCIFPLIIGEVAGAAMVALIFDHFIQFHQVFLDSIDLSSQIGSLG